MAKRNNLRKKSRLLVEHILDNDPISANTLFQQLILEAEARREHKAAIIAEADGDEDDDLELDDIDDTENMDADEETDADETEEDIDDAEADEADEAEEFDEFGDTEDSIESLDNAEVEAAADDIVEIECQINAKMISNLFDKIGELKNAVINLGLDENSREYLEYDVSIQYYSDKLQELQNKTNPGIDQSKVETGIQKIEAAIEQLMGKAGINDDSGIDDIDSPEEVAAGIEDTEDTDVEETDVDSEEEDDTEAEADVDADVEPAEDEEDIEALFQ